MYSVCQHIRQCEPRACSLSVAAGAIAQLKFFSQHSNLMVKFLSLPSINLL